MAVAVFGILTEREAEGFEFTKRTHYPRFDNSNSESSTYRPVTWGAGPGSPPKYTDIFGYARSYDTVVPYDNVPGVLELTEFVAAQPALHEFLWPQRTRDIFKDDYLTSSVAQLPLAMVERHLHLDGWKPNAAALDRYFEELVRFWVQEQLDVELLIPILGIDFDTDHLDLDDVSVRRMTEMEQRARWPGERLGDNDGYVEMATHALVVPGWYVQPQDLPASLFMASPPEHVDQLDRFIRALATVTDDPSGYNQIIINPVGWASGYTADLPPLQHTSLVGDRRSTRLKKANEPQDSLDAGRLTSLKAAYDVDATSKPIRLAAQRLTSAELRIEETDRVVDLCIGLEALLSDAGGETTYKIAVRGATLLGHSGIDNASEFYRALKRIYGYRSAIVHGSTRAPATVSTIAGVEYRTEELTRMILRRLLSTRVDDPALGPEAIDTFLLGAAINSLAKPTPPAGDNTITTTSTEWLADIALPSEPA